MVGNLSITTVVVRLGDGRLRHPQSVSITWTIASSTNRTLQPDSCSGQFWRPEAAKRLYRTIAALLLRRVRYSKPDPGLRAILVGQLTGWSFTAAPTDLAVRDDKIVILIRFSP
jgi:hypothetical protein